MEYSNPTVSIITLKVNDLNAPNRRECQSGSKDMVQLYGICKKPTLNIKMLTD